MYQILPLRALVSVFVWLGVSLVLILSSWMPYSLRVGLVITNLLLFFLTLKPVWRWFWKQVPRLKGLVPDLFENWFPDLNGDYDVVLQSNWPRQKLLLDAAAGSETFNPRDPNAEWPGLRPVKLRASIDLSFYWVRVRMWDEDAEQPFSIISESRTLVASLLRPCDGQPPRLAYIYQQRNRRDRQKSTDDPFFEGAAILRIGTREKKELELTGEYWTNRGWHQGLGSAGFISFTRRPE